MKRLKRKTAGLLCAAMLVSTVMPVAANGETASDDTVTVEVKNVPGGVVFVEEEETGKIFPLDRPVEIQKGNTLMITPVVAYYDDDTWTEYANLFINGEPVMNIEEDYISADQDMVLQGEFLRLQYESDADGVSALMDDEWANPENRQSLSFKTPEGKFKTNIYYDRMDGGIYLQLYDRRTGKMACGDFRIEDIEQMNAEYPRGIDFTADCFISEDGILEIPETLENGSSYRIRIYQYENRNGRDRRMGTSVLYINAGTNRIVPNFEVAKGEGITDAYGTAETQFESSLNRRISEALEGQKNILYGTTVKGWRDDDGRTLGSRTVGDLSDYGYIPVYAEYSDYNLPVVQKPETITTLIDIGASWSGDGEDPTFYFYENGQPVKNAFIQYDGDEWWYLDENGEVVKDMLINASKDTPWYQNINGQGYSLEHKDQDTKGKIVYYANADGELVTNSWVAVEPESDEFGEFVYWYYFDQNGRAFADGSWTINGKQYHFDEEGRCLMPGWFVQDDTWVFLDTDGKTVKNAFVKSGEDTFYIGADGHLTEEAQVVKTNRNTLFYTEGKELGEITWSKPNQDYKFRSIYYLIDDEGKIQIDAWDESHEMYFGKDGKAYQDCSAVIDGGLYTFDKDGIGEVREPIEEDKPSKVAAEVEKLDLFVNEEDANTREEAAAFVEDAITVLLPMGYEVATVSDAKRAGSNAFQAAEDGKDGFWRFDAELTYGEKIATGSEATGSNARRARVATGSTAEDGRSTVIAENCLLTIRAAIMETNDLLQQAAEAAADAVKKLALTQENTPDQKAAEKAIMDAIEAVLPEGYEASYRFEYQAPVAGTRADRDGTDGWIKATCTIKDADGYEMTFAETAAIAATPYTGSGSSSNGGSSGGGSSTGWRAAVMDTVGTWQQDAAGWRFLVQNTGTYAQNAWHRINGKWYYFGQNTYAVTGWNLIDGKWYYMDETNCDMQTGWHEDKVDGNWYFLHQDGSLALGWIQVGGKSYYLNMISEGPTYTQDAATGRWFFNGNSNLPYGAMLKSTRTPDGYFVGADGAWDGNPKA